MRKAMNGSYAPRLWSIILTTLVALWVLEDISRQAAYGPGTITILFVPLVCLVLFLDYLCRLLLYCGYRLSTESEPNTGPGVYDMLQDGGWRWLVLPVAFAATLIALLHPWPMILRFALSRDEFERKVVEVIQSGEDQGPQRVGLYWVEGIFTHGNGYVGFKTGWSLIDPVGIAHDPTHPRSSHPYCNHLTGNWYATEW